MSSKLIPPSFLFRFSAECRYKKELWGKTGTKLSATHALPALGKLNGQAPFAEVRAAWSEQGLGFRVLVKGKSEPPSSDPRYLEESDGFGVWVDTRDTQNIHRASRFCHRFLFLPAGGGRNADEPYGVMLRINRAKEDPKTFSSELLTAACKLHKDGYQLDALVPAERLTGFDPAEYPKLGFFYALSDQELGWNTWFHGPEFPFAEDPSLWGTLELR